MIDRHLVQQMDKALSLRAERRIDDTNEQALLAFLLHSNEAHHMAEIVDRSYWFRSKPVWGGEAIEGHNCWITPKGGIFSVCYSGHSRFASIAMGFECSLLERAGWLHVSASTAWQHYDRYSSAQLRVVEEYGMRLADARQHSAGRLADDAKNANLRGLEFRQRDGWDWRTGVVREDYPTLSDARLVRELVRDNTIAY